MNPKYKQLKQCSLDLWLLYGSFSYGLECHIFRLENDTLIAEICSDRTPSSDELFQLIDHITDSPKGLIRSVLRLYHGDEAQPFLSLTTELSPMLLSDESSAKCALKFSHVKGITEQDAKIWTCLQQSVCQSY